ncbi:MAG: PD-(D/E)XK nuclease family protein [Lachnospirales bacterium]
MKYILSSKFYNTNKIAKMLLKLEKEKQIIYIVPEQSTLHTERTLMEKSGRKAIMQSQVYSFKRLAFKTLSEVGDNNLEPLDDTAKGLILRKIIEEKKESFKFYKNASNKIGFIEEISNIITEFQSYSISPQNIKDKLAMDDIGILGLKMSDIYEIYISYCSYIESRYITPEITLDYLNNKIQFSNNIKNSIIVLDGFIALTPQEYKILEKLLLYAYDVLFVFPINEVPKKEYFDNINKGDIFYEIKNIWNKIYFFSKEINLNTEFVALEEDCNESDLTYLQNNYFKEAKVIDGKNIELSSCKNKYEEITLLCENIIRLVRDNGYRYSDIGVFTNARDKSTIEGILSQYNIPYFLDEKDKIISLSLPTLILDIVNVVVSNHSYESVFKILKSELMSFDSRSLEILENYALEYGIKGYKWKRKVKNSENSEKILDDIYEDLNSTEKEVFDISFEDFYNSKKYDMEKINKTKDEVLKKLMFFTYKIDKKEYDIVYLTKKIFRFLINNSVHEKLLGIEEYLNDVGDFERVKEYSQIWEKTINVFNKLNEFLKDTKVTINDFYKILEAGFVSEELATLPSKVDEVLIGDIKRTISEPKKVVCLITLNEGIIPSIYNENKLLSDDEKDFLSDKKISLSENSKKLLIRENLYFYRVLQLAEEKLFLSYSQRQLNGDMMFPSPYINKIKNIVNISEKNYKEDLTISVSLFKKISELIPRRSAGLSEKEEAIFQFFYNKEEYKYIIDLLINMQNEKNIKEKLSESLVSKFYGNELITSVSRLERYVRCPYLYFIDYNLKAKDRVIYEADYIDYGNLFHYILEKYDEYIANEKIKWSDVEDEQIKNIVDSIVIDSLKENSIYLSSSRYESFLERISNISKKSIWALREHIRHGNFQVTGSEVEFSKEENALTLEVDGKKIYLVGKIDRIDIYDDNGVKYVKVLDYKSGNTEFSIDEIYHGTQLQLIVYLMAILESADLKAESMPGGMFYFKIQNPKVESNSYSTLLKEFMLSGVFLSEEEDSKKVLALLDNNFKDGSAIVPAGIKKDGEFTTHSNYFTENEFENAFAYTKEKLREICKNIYSGNINVNPILKDDFSTCSYCKHKNICKKDLKDKVDYNVLNKVNKDIFKNAENK